MRLVLPDRVATAFIVHQRRLSNVWRFWFGCGVETDARFTMESLPGDAIGRGEVMVGHENRARPGRICWVENDFAARGAVHFPLTLVDARPGFHEHEQAFLTWRMADASTRVGGPFLHCTSAIQQVGTAAFDWTAGVYLNTTPDPRRPRTERHHLEFGHRTFGVSDTDVSVPGTAATGLRRVDVTDAVREWVERQEPNFGFVLKGDESFARPGNMFGGAFTVEGHIWERCLAIYSGFELTFAPIGETPPWGRLP
jgi:hypothetical protein